MRIESPPSSADKELLIITCTHGNEDFANEPLERLTAEFGNRFDWLIGNPRAMEEGTRFTEVDMNRIAPGDPADPRYEMQRAVEVLEIAKQYPYVLDIHGTTADCGVFTILPYPTGLKRFALAAALPIDDIVVWADEEERKAQTGPLTPFMPCAVAIECGPKASPEVADRLYDVLREIVRDGIGECLRRAKTDKNVYRVYDSLKTADVAADFPLKDFTETTVNGETFTPLLARQYDATACYKMKKVDLFEMFRYSAGKETRSSA